MERPSDNSIINGVHLDNHKVDHTHTICCNMLDTRCSSQTTEHVGDCFSGVLIVCKNSTLYSAFITIKTDCSKHYRRTTDKRSSRSLLL